MGFARLVQPSELAVGWGARVVQQLVQGLIGLEQGGEVRHG
jgi:hypothetical protein